MKPSRLPLIVMACIAAGAVLVGSYVGGYLWLSRAYSIGDGPDVEVVIRRFPARWLALFFQPAASIESRFRQQEVEPLSKR